MQEDQTNGNEELALRWSPSSTRAEEWALVLASAGIAHRTVAGGGGFAVVVTVADAAAARQALAAFDAESAPVVEPAAPDLGPSSLGIAMAALLVAFFVVAGGRDTSGAASAWFRAGTASAELILHGQWWRAVTALALHADVPHLAGNVLASLLFASAVGRWLGFGLGGALILVSATAGNLLTAVSHGTAHYSVGASTATFAALGVLAGLQVVRRLRHGQGSAISRRRAWLLPLGAGLALFAMLGVAPQADVRAHLFGLGMGVVTGALAGALRVRGPRLPVQVALAAVCLAALAGCWALAFRAAG